jgi:acid phosphatase
MQHVSSVLAESWQQHTPGDAMMFWRSGSMDPDTRRKGFFTLKRHALCCVAILILILAPPGLNAQQPVARESSLAPAERIANLDVLKAQLRQYHECTCTCGCYAKDLDVQANRAIAFLRVRAAHRRPQEKLALVLDIDETTLSNYEEMTKADFAYDSKVFSAWVESARAPAIAGTLRLYQEAQRLGVSVFFLTGRAEAQRAATEQNLRGQGFQNWQQLILRPPAEATANALAYKSRARAVLQAQGYTLVLNVGDQWSDLRGQPQAEFSVKYPDPFYFIQ